jgi:mono/diheme cytochrome c family protein
MNNFKLWILALVAVVILNACSPAEGNFAGSEYMPDMGHSVAIEANTYGSYHYNTWDKESTIKKADIVRGINAPVSGAIPMGYAGAALQGNVEATMNMLLGKSGINAISIPVNGRAPYYYSDTEEERLRATAEIIDNPFPITAAGLAKGQEMYNIYCGICHGEKGNGLGYLYAEENPNAKYPAAPANFLNEEFSAASNGRYYHAIMYGKNVMGGYSDKLSYEERWQVIHWIRSLQAQDKKLKYDENDNTLNLAFGTPKAKVVVAVPVTDAAPAPVEATEGTHSTDNSHGESSGHSTGSGSHGGHRR